MRREKKDQILAVLPEKIRGILLNHGLDFEKIQEIRLREEQPLAVKKEGKEELFTHRVTKEELRETMEYVDRSAMSNELGKMQKDRLIEVDRKHFRILGETEI